MFDVANMLKKFTRQDIPINNYELLNVLAFIPYVLEHEVHPVSSGKLQVLISSSNIHKSFRL